MILYVLTSINIYILMHLIKSNKKSFYICMDNKTNIDISYIMCKNNIRFLRSWQFKNLKIMKEIHKLLGNDDSTIQRSLL